MAKSEKEQEKIQSPFQVAVLFEGTGLDGDSQSNVGRLARALVRDDRQHVILKHGSGTYPFARLGGRIAGTDALRILSDASAQLSRICEPHAGEPPPRVFLFGFSRGAVRQGLRLKEGAKLSEALAPDPVVHNSLADPTNFWGALEGVRRKIDPKRLHRSVKKILTRILAPDGHPVPPETFKDAPTA